MKNYGRSHVAERATMKQELTSLRNEEERPGRN